MSKVISGMSMSLDGFVTGPNVTREQQLGDGGDVLHRWLGSGDPRDEAVLTGMGEGAGAILMGRRSYDLAEGDGGWGDGGPAGPLPCVVLTHSPPPRTRFGRLGLHVRHRRHPQRGGAGEGGSR